MISHENISASNQQKNNDNDAVQENPKIETFEIADTYKA